MCRLVTLVYPIQDLFTAKMTFLLLVAHTIFANLLSELQSVNLVDSFNCHIDRQV